MAKILLPETQEPVLIRNAYNKFPLLSSSHRSSPELSKLMAAIRAWWSQQTAGKRQST